MRIRKGESFWTLAATPPSLDLNGRTGILGQGTASPVSSQVVQLEEAGLVMLCKLLAHRIQVVWHTMSLSWRISDQPTPSNPYTVTGQCLPKLHPAGAWCRALGTVYDVLSCDELLCESELACMRYVKSASAASLDGAQT